MRDDVCYLKKKVGYLPEKVSYLAEKVSFLKKKTRFHKKKSPTGLVGLGVVLGFELCLLCVLFCEF